MSPIESAAKVLTSRNINVILSEQVSDKWQQQHNTQGCRAYLQGSAMGGQADLGFSNRVHSMQCAECGNVRASPKKKKGKGKGVSKPLSFMGAAGTCCRV